MMQKRSLWAVLFVMLLMALSVNGAVAEDDALRSGDYQYRVLEDGTAEITDYFGRNSVVSIPETLIGWKNGNEHKGCCVCLVQFLDDHRAAGQRDLYGRKSICRL